MNIIASALSPIHIFVNVQGRVFIKPNELKFVILEERHKLEVETNHWMIENVGVNYKLLRNFTQIDQTCWHVKDDIYHSFYKTHCTSTK